MDTETISSTIVDFVKEHTGKYDKYAIARILTGQGDRQTYYYGRLSLSTDDEVLTHISALEKDGIFHKQKIPDYDQPSRNKLVVCLSATAEEIALLSTNVLDPLLLQKLKQWRSKTAGLQDKALYKIATNDVLEKLATLQPSTHQQLLSISSLRQDVIRTHSVSLLNVIADHLYEQGTVRIRNDNELLQQSYVFDEQSHLNDEQQLAAFTDLSSNPQLACIAGAGAGKTTVLVQKIAHLIISGADPKNILAITFTRNAAQELRDRLVSVIGSAGSQIHACTFNSFCEQILQKNNPLTVIDELQSQQLMSIAAQTAGISGAQLASVFSDDDFSDDVDYTRRFMRLCQQLQQLSAVRSTTPSEIVTAIAEKKGNVAPLTLAVKALDSYVSLKTERGLRDYTDQMTQLLALLDQDPSVLATLQQKYTSILVDEYQDVNIIQDTLIRKLLTANSSLFIVGDPRQSIYGFREADPSLLLDCKDSFPHLRIVELVSNYRSQKKIVDFANALIAPLGYAQNQQARRTDTDGEIHIYEYLTPEEEAINVAQRIKLLRLRKGINHSDVLVLTRTHKQLALLQRVFVQCDVDFIMLGKGQGLPHQVKMSTVHGAKGLESDVVFVCGLVEGLFPMRARELSALDVFHGGRSTAEEELRLLYVAVTRARNHLFLTWWRKSRGITRKKSSFLTPQLEELTVNRK